MTNTVIRPRTVVVHLQNARITLATVVCSFGLVILALFTPFLPMMSRHFVVCGWVARRRHNGQIVRDPYHCEVYLESNLRRRVHVVAEDEIVGWVANSGDQ